MKYSKLGKTGLTSSQIGFGTFPFDNDIWHEDIDENEAVELMLHANKLGVNYFNSALYYGKGECERLLGKAINEMKREDVIVCTKVGSHTYKAPLDLSRDYILQSVEDTLKRMKLDYLDVLLLHAPDPTTPIEESMETLNELRDQKIIRHQGISNHSLDQAKEAMKYGPVEIMEFYFSLLTQQGTARGNKKLRNFCKKNDIAVTPFRVIERGILTNLFPNKDVTRDMNELYESPYQNEKNRDKLLQLHAKLTEFAEEHNVTLAQLAIAWSLRQEGITTALVGMTEKWQIDENTQATELNLDKDVFKHLEKVVGNYKFEREGRINTRKKK